MRPRPIIVLISTSFTSHPIAVIWPSLQSYFTGSYLVVVHHTEFDRNQLTTLRGKENNERDMKLSGREGEGGSSTSKVAYN